MYKYALRNIFSRSTGKKEGKKLTKVGYICDFCGEEIQVVDWPLYTVIECRDAEPMFYELNVKGNEGDSKFPRHSIFDNHQAFLYCVDLDRDAGNCEDKMIKWAVKHLTNHQDIPLLTVHNMMYYARIEMLQKLLDSGKYTYDQLGLTELLDLIEWE